MVYKTLDVHLIIAIVLLLLVPFSLSAREGVSASSYLLVEKDTFQVISGRDYDQKRAPASTTKVLTTIVALEKLQGNEIIVPDKTVTKIPASKLNLIPGKQYEAGDLIKGTMIESANDAAYTIASHIGGTEESFARMMNEKARSIGAYDSNFRNASGLFVEGQYTTCWDLALMFRYALESDNFRNIIATRYFLFNDSKRSVRYKNHNRLLFCFEPTIGGKTGFTRASKHTYVGAFEKEGRVYILSMLGSNNLWGDAVKILQDLYTDLPSDKEIRLAKSNSLTLTSYKQEAKKTTTAKKKTAKYRKGTKKVVAK
jgi:D-alanyl-D-alanine carboxypeptidase (penicillin-binding protein 5/6)